MSRSTVLSASEPAPTQAHEQPSRSAPGVSFETRVRWLMLAVVLLSGIASALYQSWQIWQVLRTSQLQQARSLSRLLDAELGADLLALLADERQPIATRVQQAHAHLQPRIDFLLAAFPGMGGGVYSQALRSIVAYGPDPRPEGLRDLRPDSPARQVYQTGEPLEYESYSQTRNAPVLAIIHPVQRDGLIIGHVWANITRDQFLKLVWQLLLPQLLLTVLLLLLALLGLHLIGLRFRQSLQQFREQVRQRHLLSVSDAAGTFSPELLAVYEEVVDAYGQLASSEARFRDVTTAFDEYVWEADTACRYTWLSPRAAQVLHSSVDHWLGQPLFTSLHPDDLPTVHACLSRLLDEGTPFRDLDYRRWLNDGHCYWFRVSGIPIRDAEGRILGIRGATRDVTELKTQTQRVEFLAYHDELSGLLNRTAIHRELADWCARLASAGAGFTVLFFNIDRFDQINDSYGYPVGDRLIVELAHLLQRHQPAGSALGRHGDDEFLLLLPGTERAAALTLATTLAKACARPLLQQPAPLRVQLNTGIAFAPMDGGQPELLVPLADLAMRQAKQRRGPGQIGFSDPSHSTRLRADLQLQQQMPMALDEGQFFLEYQPQIRLSDGRPIGIEALVRWQHPRHGHMPPGQFIALAEDSHFIIALGHWILRSACAFARALQQDRPGTTPLRIAVNVSAVQFHQSDLDQQVLGVLMETGLPAALLELEITESIAMSDPEWVAGRLRGLAAAGVRLALDDFGTGYSSLVYLQKFPFDLLKIDRTFVVQAALHNRDRHLLDAMIQMARHLDLQVLAEGVERDEQRQILAACGCELAQGFLFGRPMPAAHLRDWLREREGC